MHIDLDLLPLNVRRHIRLAGECYKATNLQPYSLQEFFVPIVRVTGPRTRAQGNTTHIVPRCQTDTGRKAFSYRGPRVWKEIPTEFKNKPSYDSFKVSYLKFVKDMHKEGENHTFPT